MGYSQWEYESHKSFPHRDSRNHIIDLKASGKSTKCPWAWANFCPGSQRSLSLREIDVELEIVFLLLQWNIFVQYKNKCLPFSWDYQFVGPAKDNIQGWSLRLTDGCLQWRIHRVWADWHAQAADLAACPWPMSGSLLPARAVSGGVGHGYRTKKSGTLSNSQALVYLSTSETNKT